MQKLIPVLVCILLFNNISNSQPPQLEKLWQTDTLLKVPESVYFDTKNQVLYVANIDGQPWEQDGKGSIGKVTLDGKIINAEWITGLDAPKGMGLIKNKLYVADVDKVVIIDIDKGAIINKIPFDGAEGLNDITVDQQDRVFVSDSRKMKVYLLENDKPAVYLENLQGPNGILAHNNILYVLDKGGLYKTEKNKSLTKITDGMEGGTDGVVPVSNDEFIVSCWAGAIWYVNGNGTKQLLLDTRDSKINSADIAYDPKNKIVYVPTFWKNSVVAYQFK